MNTAFLLSAFMLGFFGSFHCIGMCGAIALSLPVQQLQGWKKVVGIILYNFGRVCTYALLGGILGSIGSTFQLWGLQQTVSIILGALLILLSILSFTHYQWKNNTLMQKWNDQLILIIAPLFKSKKVITPFYIGILNGLLPCGLVYMAIAGAVATHHLFDGMIFMASFGIGTLPVMLLACFTGQFISVKWRMYIRKASPFIIACMGVLLILRGANLNIPYLSPVLAQGHVKCCHR
jgi:sulfite exporter TauE/SafE